MAQVIFTSFFLLLTLLLGLEVSAQQCGREKLCPNGLCCSQYGYCGSTDEYCCDGCQSQCNCGGVGSVLSKEKFGGVGSILSKEKFEEMLMHRNNDDCPAKGFYTYEAFISAAEAFPEFATNKETAEKELAAFFGQTSHETTGGWKDAPDGPYAWGYCFKKEIKTADYCDPSSIYPCVPGKQYYGRGPIQLTGNHNYGLCGDAIREDLLNNPDLVETYPIISFKAAIWFWMTPQPPKPSCHDVITGSWSPSENDFKAGRLPGYGVTTNIINGGRECGEGENAYNEDRIGYYKRYCDMFGVVYGDNLDCYNQKPFGNQLLDMVTSKWFKLV